MSPCQKPPRSVRPFWQNIDFWQRDRPSAVASTGASIASRGYNVAIVDVKSTVNSPQWRSSLLAVCCRCAHCAWLCRRGPAGTRWPCGGSTAQEHTSSASATSPSPWPLAMRPPHRKCHAHCRWWRRPMATGRSKDSRVQTRFSNLNDI